MFVYAFYYLVGTEADLQAVFLICRFQPAYTALFRAETFSPFPGRPEHVLRGSQ